MRDDMAVLAGAARPSAQPWEPFHPLAVEFLTALSAAVRQGCARREELAQATLRDHALLMEFFVKRDPEGTRHAMAVHMRHAMDEMGLEID